MNLADYGPRTLPDLLDLKRTSSETDLNSPEDLSPSNVIRMSSSNGWNGKSVVVRTSKAWRRPGFLSQTSEDNEEDGDNELPRLHASSSLPAFQTASIPNSVSSVFVDGSSPTTKKAKKKVSILRPKTTHGAANVNPQSSLRPVLVTSIFPTAAAAAAAFGAQTPPKTAPAGGKRTHTTISHLFTDMKDSMLKDQSTKKLPHGMLSGLKQLSDEEDNGFDIRQLSGKINNKMKRDRRVDTTVESGSRDISFLTDRKNIKLKGHKSLAKLDSLSPNGNIKLSAGSPLESSVSNPLTVTKSNETVSTVSLLSPTDLHKVVRLHKNKESVFDNNDHSVMNDEDTHTEVAIEESFNSFMHEIMQSYAVAEDEKTTSSSQDKLWRTRQFASAVPAGRRDVILLNQWMNSMVANHIDSDKTASDEKKTRATQFIYSLCFKELVRQVSLQCTERGKSIATLWQLSMDLSRKLLQTKMRHALEVEQKCEEDLRVNQEMCSRRMADADALVAHVKEDMQFLNRSLEVKQEQLESLVYRYKMTDAKCTKMRQMLNDILAKINPTAEADFLHTAFDEAEEIEARKFADSLLFRPLDPTASTSLAVISGHTEEVAQEEADFFFADAKKEAESKKPVSIETQTCKEDFMCFYEAEAETQTDHVRPPPRLHNKEIQTDRGIVMDAKGAWRALLDKRTIASQTEGTVTLTRANSDLEMDRVLNMSSDSEFSSDEDEDEDQDIDFNSPDFDPSKAIKMKGLSEDMQRYLHSLVAFMKEQGADNLSQILDHYTDVIKQSSESDTKDTKVSDKRTLEGLHMLVRRSTLRLLDPPSDKSNHASPLLPIHLLHSGSTDSPLESPMNRIHNREADSQLETGSQTGSARSVLRQDGSVPGSPARSAKFIGSAPGSRVGSARSHLGSVAASAIDSMTPLASVTDSAASSPVTRAPRKHANASKLKKGTTKRGNGKTLGKRKTVKTGGEEDGDGRHEDSERHKGTQAGGNEEEEDDDEEEEDGEEGSVEAEEDGEERAESRIGLSALDAEANMVLGSDGCDEEVETEKVLFKYLKTFHMKKKAEHATGGPVTLPDELLDDSTKLKNFKTNLKSNLAQSLGQAFGFGGAIGSIGGPIGGPGTPPSAGGIKFKTRTQSMGSEGDFTAGIPVVTMGDPISGLELLPAHRNRMESDDFDGDGSPENASPKSKISIFKSELKKLKEKFDLVKMDKESMENKVDSLENENIQLREMLDIFLKKPKADHKSTQTNFDGKRRAGPMRKKTEDLSLMDGEEDEDDTDIVNSLLGDDADDDEEDEDDYDEEEEDDEEEDDDEEDSEGDTANRKRRIKRKVSPTPAMKGRTTTSFNAPSMLQRGGNVRTITKKAAFVEKVVTKLLELKNDVAGKKWLAKQRASTKMMLLKELGQLYLHKNNANKENPGFLGVSMAQYVNDYYMHRYGLKKMAEKRFVEMCVGAMKTQSESLRIRIFARMLGIFQPLDIEMQNWYLALWDFLRSSTNIGVSIENDETAEVQWAPVSRALECARIHLSEKVPQDVYHDVTRKIEAMGRPDPKRINKSGRIEIEKFLDFMLTTYSKQLKQSQSSLRHLYMAADTNGDGSLSVLELGILCQIIEPHLVGHREAQRMFDAAQRDFAFSLSEHGGDMPIEVFCEVALRFSLFSPATIAKKLTVPSSEDEEKSFELLKQSWLDQKDSIMALAQRAPPADKHRVMGRSTHLEQLLAQREHSAAAWMCLRLLEIESKRIALDLAVMEFMPVLALAVFAARNVTDEESDPPAPSIEST